MLEYPDDHNVLFSSLLLFALRCTRTSFIMCCFTYIWWDQLLFANTVKIISQCQYSALPLAIYINGHFLNLILFYQWKRVLLWLTFQDCMAKAGCNASRGSYAEVHHDREWVVSILGDWFRLHICESYFFRYVLIFILFFVCLGNDSIF